MATGMQEVNISSNYTSDMEVIIESLLVKAFIKAFSKSIYIIKNSLIFIYFYLFVHKKSEKIVHFDICSWLMNL